MKIKNINFNKMKKTTLALAIGASIVGVGLAVPIIETNAKEIKNKDNKQEVIYNSAYAVIDAAKYEYLGSLFEDEVITSGEVKDLNVIGVETTAGTWESIDMDNDGTPEIVLNDVEINGCIVNTNSTTDEYDLNIKVRKFVK